MNKWMWAAAGAAAVLVAGSVAGVITVADATKNIKYASDTSGDYEIDLIVSPGRVSKGNGQSAVIVLRQNGKPMANAQVNLKITQNSGTTTQTMVTDINGVAMWEIVSFDAQTMTLTASYQSAGGTTVQTSATPTWCNCGRSAS